MQSPVDGGEVPKADNDVGVGWQVLNRLSIEGTERERTTDRVRTTDDVSNHRLGQQRSSAGPGAARHSGHRRAGQRMRHPQQQHLRQAAGVRDARGRPRAPGGVPTIADDSEDPVYRDSRAAGTDGYADSVDYVADLLEDAGYEVSLTRVVHFHLPGRAAAADAGRRRRTRPVRSPAAVPATSPVTSSRSTSISTASGCQHQRLRGGGLRPLDFPAPTTSRSIQRGTCTFGAEGGERRGRRRRGGGHHQPGRTPRAR